MSTNWEYAIKGLCVVLLAALVFWLGARKEETKVAELAEEEPSGVIEPLYFFSYSEDMTIENCPAAKDINWDLAIIALSDYMEYGAGAENKEDIGPAEIQRNFNENCERNMRIYNDVKARNPELFEG